MGVTLKERQQWEEERLSCGTDVQKDFRKLVALAKLVFVAGKSAGHSEMHILDLGTPNVKDPEWKEVITTFKANSF